MSEETVVGAQPDHVRIFMVDQTSYEMRLSVPWEVLVNMLLTHKCIITTDAWINQSSIVRMMRFNPGSAAPRETAMVLNFPEPKGSA